MQLRLLLKRLRRQLETFPSIFASTEGSAYDEAGALGVSPDVPRRPLLFREQRVG